jgi:glycosyltransferase involved in cell wall biosynthesis
VKLLLVNVSLDARLGGGTAERTRHLALHLAQAGCSCETVAITGNSWAREFAAAGVRWTITGAIGRRFPLPLVRPWRTWRAVRRADAVHIMGYWNLLSIITGLLARLARTPYVLCPAGEFASIDRPRPIMRMFHEMVGKGLIRNASAFIAITAAERDVIARVAGCAKESVWIVPNAVSIPRAPADAGTASGVPEAPYLLFMGRLAPIKGPDLLLAAYLAEPAAHAFPLVFAGADLGMRPALERTARASHVAPRIHFLGFVGESERAALYQRALMLVIPSRSEAMSLVALEAGSHGVPVLLTDACGFDEVARAGGGTVVPPSVEGLREGLLQMLARPETLPAMGASLKALVAERYSWPSVAAELIRRFEQLTGEPRTSARSSGA